MDKNTQTQVTPMSEEAFVTSVQSLLVESGIPYLFTPGSKSFSPNEEQLSHSILSHQMLNSAACYATICWILEYFSRSSQNSRQITHILTHAIFASSHLLNLQMPVSIESLDHLIASSLFYGLAQVDKYLPERISYSLKPHLNAQIRLVSNLLLDDELLCSDKQNLYYENIQKCLDALLVSLAWQGISIRNLHTSDFWDVKKCIHDTRTYYFPMCIYGKEHYPEYLGIISILMEKMRCLLDVAEILSARYEARETELIKEILTLQEDNARMRSIIALLE